MLDIKLIRENPEKINELLRRRNPELSIDKVIEIDAERRKVQAQADELRAKRKTESQKIGMMKKMAKILTHFKKKSERSVMKLRLLKKNRLN